VSSFSFCEPACRSLLTARADAVTRTIHAFCSDEAKKAATSKKIYRNERGVPMWYCGYEGETMREAFRVCSGMTDIGSWPSPEFQNAWMDLTVSLDLAFASMSSLVLLVRNSHLENSCRGRNRLIVFLSYLTRASLCRSSFATFVTGA
jgi:hypothetical protein